MKIPVHIAEKLLLLSNGNSIPDSSAKHPLIDDLVEECILERRGRIKKTIILCSNESLNTYLQNHCGISNLMSFINVCKQDDRMRSDLVAVAGDSKLNRIRTFKGFLLNCYAPAQVTLNRESTILQPKTGTFSFIYDFENFFPSPFATIVGIENAENFRHIDRQKYLFSTIAPLFVSRYPQNQSKDLLKWLQSIPNRYLHFGDFDFAGIGIYLYEFKKYLKDNSTFFIPDNIDQLIKKYGSKERYNQQKMSFDVKSVKEEGLLKLINSIHQYKKGLDQELLINENPEIVAV